MTAPIIPDPDQQPAAPSQGSKQPEGYSSNAAMNSEKIWTRFFQEINPGQTVTPQEVKAFQMGIMRWFNLIIAQEAKSWKRTQDTIKKTWEQ